MRDLDAFLLGYKPALLDTVLSEDFATMLPDLKRKYPYITEGIGLRDDVTTYMFFQTEEQKKSFQQQLEKVAPKSPEFHKILGLALGYPPKAVEFHSKLWSENEEAKQLELRKVGMHYYGITCNGNVDDLIENCLWLWDTYNFPDGPKDTLEVRIHTNFYPVEYKDVDTLKKLQEQVWSMIDTMKL